ncbi:Hypothetical predicted protein [Pelobates cultripes]|uniref:Uncharacterized protein n=1 Tax=Pelobates cultripes TaxID=61616 RepID=A0AAD1SYM3_PELCU|nr:Hypothetical predicted protein [Pelobates cultripes]
MAQSKPKKTAAKADKLSFFSQKGATASEAARLATQDCAENYNPKSASHTEEEPSSPQGLTRDYFERAMEAMAEKLISTWKSTADQSTAPLLQNLPRGATMLNLTSQQTETKDHLHSLQQQLEAMEVRMANYEDRARRNNLRLREVGTHR